MNVLMIPLRCFIQQDELNPNVLPKIDIQGC